MLFPEDSTFPAYAASTTVSKSTTGSPSWSAVGVQSGPQFEEADTHSRSSLSTSIVNVGPEQCGGTRFWL
jgi:hypothetical protein